MTKQKTKSKILIIASLALLAVLVIGLSVGLSSAKYKTEKVMQGNVKFTAELAKKIEVVEHKVTRQEDGSYTMDPAATSSANDYMLMPGVDIPKDPYVVVTGKTSIPAFLYVEIVESTDFPEKVTYVTTDDWSLVKDTNGNPVAGLNGGKVYVYNTQLTNANTLDSTQFQVLKADANGNTLTVSQNLPRGTSAKLDFYAYICQVVEGDAAKDFKIFSDAEATAGNSGN